MRTWSEPGKGSWLAPRILERETVVDRNIRSLQDKSIDVRFKPVEAEVFHVDPVDGVELTGRFQLSFANQSLLEQPAKREGDRDLRVPSLLTLGSHCPDRHRLTRGTGE